MNSSYRPACNRLCKLVEKSEKQDVIKIFREIVEYLEFQRKILDFPLKIREVGPSFVVEVFYGHKKDGPEEVGPGDCLSRNPDAPLYPEAQPVITAGESAS